MKKYLRLYLYNLFSLWVIINLLKGVSLENSHQTLAVTAIILTLVNSLIKPLINILLFPLNILTLGIFRWVTNAITLYLVTLIVSEFKISSFNFPGFFYKGIVIPPMYIPKIWVLIIASFIISLIISFLSWLNK